MLKTNGDGRIWSASVSNVRGSLSGSLAVSWIVSNWFSRTCWFSMGLRVGGLFRQTIGSPRQTSRNSSETETVVSWTPFLGSEKVWPSFNTESRESKRCETVELYWTHI